MRYNTPTQKAVANIHRITHAPKAKPKMETLSRTFADAPSELMTLCVLEDKARNLVCSTIRKYIIDSDIYRSNAHVKAYADLILTIGQTHEISVLKTLSMDEQVQFADLCEHYDELLDSIVADMQNVLNEQLLSIPKAKRDLWSRVVTAGYVALVCVIYQNAIREHAGVIYKLNGRLVDSVPLLGIAEKCDKIVTEIWGGDVVLQQNKMYDALDTEFCQRLTDPDFFYDAAVDAGFTHYEKLTTH